MILNIRGTSGSGKTTLARAVMGLYGVQQPRLVEGRRQPLYVSCLPLDVETARALYVLGHYNTPCGGCDTITKLDDVFELAANLSEHGDVLMEGLLLSGEVRRTCELSAIRELKVLQLSTPLDRCIKNVESRRLERGDERPLNPANTIAKDKTVASVCKRLADAGVPVVRGDYEALLQVAREALHV